MRIATWHAVRAGSGGMNHLPDLSAPCRLLTLLLLASVAACDAPDATEEVARDSAGVMITVTPPRALADARVVPEPLAEVGLAEEAGSIGAVAGAVILPDGRVAVAVAMSSSLRLYDPEGRYLGDWGRPGAGPGEFGMLQAVSSQDDGLVVAEAGARRLTVLGATDGHVERLIQVRPGTLLRGGERSLSYGCCDYWGAGGAAGQLITTPPLMGGEPKPGRPKVIVAWVGDNGEVRAVAELPGPEYRPGSGSSDAMVDLHFGTSTLLRPSGRGFVATDGTAYEVRFFGAAGDLRRIARVTRPRRPVTAEVRRSDQAAYEAQVERIGLARAEAAGLLLRRDRAYPDSLPTYAALRVDELGNVWAQGAWSAGPFQQTDLDAFTSDGHYRGSTHLPSAGTLLDARSDRLLVLHQDDLGREYLVVYAVARGTPPGG